jgi:hypothetical protein
MFLGLNFFLNLNLNLNLYFAYGTHRYRAESQDGAY